MLVTLEPPAPLTLAHVQEHGRSGVGWEMGWAEKRSSQLHAHLPACTHHNPLLGAHMRKGAGDQGAGVGASYLWDPPSIRREEV